MAEVMIPSLDGSSFAGYQVTPSIGEGPALIVLRQRGESLERLHHLCDLLAEEGFVALGPYVYGEGTSNPSNDDVDVEAILCALLGCLAYARKIPGTGGSKVGAVGRGFGGKLAALLAGRSDLEAGFAIDPEEPESILDTLHDIRFPFFLRFKEGEEGLNPKMELRLRRVLDRNHVLSLSRQNSSDTILPDEEIGSFLKTCFPNK